MIQVSWYIGKYVTIQAFIKPEYDEFINNYWKNQWEKIYTCSMLKNSGA